MSDVILKVTVMGTQTQTGDAAFNALFGWGDHRWLKKAIAEDGKKRSPKRKRK